MFVFFFFCIINTEVGFFLLNNIFLGLAHALSAIAEALHYSSVLYFFSFELTFLFIST